MKKAILELNTIFLLVFLFGNLNAQSWRFPNCGDLTITNAEPSTDNPDQILITVYNECDTCETHVYTGLRVYDHTELLAEEEGVFTKQSPNNNDEYVYILNTFSEFEVSTELRVEMVGKLCDSIPWSLDVVDGVDHIALDESKIAIYPNPSSGIFYLRTDEDIRIEKVRILNAQGQIVSERKEVVSELNIEELIRGVYVLEIETSGGLVFKRIVKE